MVEVGAWRVVHLEAVCVVLTEADLALGNERDPIVVKIAIPLGGVGGNVSEARFHSTSNSEDSLETQDIVCIHENHHIHIVDSVVDIKIYSVHIMHDTFGDGEKDRPGTR